MYHTRAVILRKDEWSEADWLISALSEDFGRIRLLAQGARKLGAKLKGHLEPLSVSGLTFVRGRTMLRLVAAELKDFPPVRYNNPLVYQAAVIMAETLERNLFEESCSAKPFFNLFLNNLENLEVGDMKDTSKLNEILAAFHFDFLRLQGVAKVSDKGIDPALLYRRAAGTIVLPRVIKVGY